MSIKLQSEKNRYSDEELEEFKVLITEKLEQARQQLQIYLEQILEHNASEDAKTRNINDSTGFVASEQLQSMAARQQKHIQYLEYALLRIQNKVYGVCRETGKLISKERLRAVPHATLSIEAKQGK